MNQSDLKQKVISLEKKNGDLKVRLNKLEMYSHKNNIKVLGVNQEKNENCKMVIADLFLLVGTNIELSEMSQVHRIVTKSKPSPIILQVTNRDVKSRMWKCS